MRDREESGGSRLRHMASGLLGVVGAGVICYTVLAATLEYELVGDHFWEISPLTEQSLTWSEWRSTPPVETPTAGVVERKLTQVREAQFQTLFNVYTIHQARDPSHPDARFMCPFMNRTGVLAAVIGGEFLITGLLVLVVWGKRRTNTVTAAVA